MTLIKPLISIVLLSIITILQYVIIQPDRGQAKAMSFSDILVFFAVLILFVFYFIDRKQNNRTSRIFGLITQTAFLIYFCYQNIFYYRAENDVHFYQKQFNDLFPPSQTELISAFSLAILIIFYSMIKISFQSKKQTISKK